MEDAFTFTCGSVPFIIGPNGPIGPWGPYDLVRLFAGCVGGLIAYRVFGGALAPDGGVVALAVLAVAGGSLAVGLATAVGGLRKPAEAAPRV